MTSAVASRPGLAGTIEPAGFPGPAASDGRPQAAAANALRVAIIHYWLVGEAGGEKVVKSILNIFPQADIFALVVDWDIARTIVGDRKITTSFLQKIPFAKRFYRKLLPIMPAALENHDLTGYDLIISSEAGPSKGVLPPLGAVHVCYCHSPMRYIWDQYSEYRQSSGWLAKLIMSLSVAQLRAWDFLTAARVDHFAANSTHVAKRISQYYRRQSTVIHPPVDTDDFYVSDTTDDYYLITGRHVSYKRIDLAIAACNRLNRRLVVTGAGPETAALKRLAGPNVTFVGQCDFSDLKRYYSRARAFLMPGEEDFGIAPVEAMASGRPVIARASGGALDTVIDGFSGTLFHDATIDGLCEAIEYFESIESRFDRKAIAAHAASFSRERFESRFAAFVEEAMRGENTDAGTV
jgi:glycosyltransferase involved in cell wall biosynthesis